MISIRTIVTLALLPALAAGQGCAYPKLADNATCTGDVDAVCDYTWQYENGCAEETPVERCYCTSPGSPYTCECAASDDYSMVIANPFTSASASSFTMLVSSVAILGAVALF